MDGGVTIHFAGADDLDGVKELADAAKECLGFVHRGALQRAILRDEVLVARTGPDLVGFCHFYRRRDRVFTIYHLAVASSARGDGIGRRLVEATFEDARRRESQAIRLKCPADLPANAFYERVGFERCGSEDSRPRPLVRWTRSLDVLAPSPPR